MNKEFKLNMVAMPNFLSIQQPPRPRQEGYNANHAIPISDLTLEEATQYAE